MPESLISCGFPFVDIVENVYKYIFDLKKSENKGL